MTKGTKAFTVLELLVAVLIIGILAAFSLAGYQGYRDRAAMLKDATNQKVLAAAVKLYAYDNNALPGSISELRPVDLDRAYALMTSGRRSYTVLAYLAEKLGGDVVEAVPLPGRYYQNNLDITHCPLDNDGNGVSYQMNKQFAGKPLRVLLKPANQGKILIFESDVRGDTGADINTDVAYRHGGRQKEVMMTVGGEKREKQRDVLEPDPVPEQ